MTGWLTVRGQKTAGPNDMGHGGHGGMAGMMSSEEMAQLAAANGIDFDRISTSVHSTLNLCMSRN